MEILNEQSFKEKVENSSGVVLVDFFATWCGPCRMLSPVLEQVQNDTNATIYKVDVDENEKISREFGILSIPTMIIFSNGKQVDKINGFVPKQKIIETLNKYN